MVSAVKPRRRQNFTSCGAGAGIVLAWGAIALLNAWKPVVLDRYPPIVMDLLTLGVTVALTLITGPAMLYGVTALDGVTFCAATLVLVAVALAASLLPARKASRVDPVVALREE